MAVLKEATFPTDDEGKALLKKIRRALTNLCGHAPGKEGVLLTAPTRLNVERDVLRDNYREIWKAVHVEFSTEERVADSNHKTRRIRIGDFFLRPEHTVQIIEKVLLHEYLHLAVAIEWRAAHHGQINQIIEFNLKYAGDPNPFCMS